MSPIKPAAATLTEILLIEDNPAEIELLKFAFQDECPSYHLTAAIDGTLALGKLFDEANVYRPKAIVLGSGLPKLHPSDVVAVIKVEERTKSIPVFFRGTEYDTKSWKGPKPDYYCGRIGATFDSYIDFARKIDYILNRG